MQYELKMPAGLHETQTQELVRGLELRPGREKILLRLRRRYARKIEMKEQRKRSRALGIVLLGPHEDPKRKRRISNRMTLMGKEKSKLGGGGFQEVGYDPRSDPYSSTEASSDETGSELEYESGD